MVQLPQVENADAGPYTVCFYDPVGRTDPTGEVSGWLILSDFTWGLQNHVAGWFGLDWTINFLASMIVGLPAVGSHGTVDISGARAISAHESTHVAFVGRVHDKRRSDRP